MADEAYATVDDVRRVLQKSSFSGALNDSSQEIVQFAIQGLAEWIGTNTHKHWYESGGISEDSQGIVASSAKSRDDEHSLPTHSGYVVGAYADESNAWTTTTGTVFDTRTNEPDPKQQIRLATGNIEDDDTDDLPAYTRVRLERKNVSAVNTLSIVNEDGGYTDWVADSAFDGGVGNSFRGDDYWVRINNRGVSELYIDVHSIDDDIQTLNNAVYVDIDFGQDSLPMSVRRGVAHIVASQLVVDDEFMAGLPDQGQLVNVESKSTRWWRFGIQLLNKHWVVETDDLVPPSLVA